MRYTNYRNAPSAIRNMENFKGNSWSGYWLDSTQYVIFSYATEIARFDRLTQAVIMNPRKYSTTTSRQQNIIRKAWGLN